MITVRKATHADAVIIADMSRETFYATFAGQNRPEDMDKFMNEQFTQEKLMAELYDPENIFFLAFDENIPAGYAKMREGGKPEDFENADSTEIARIYAAVNYTGKGAGSALMQKCIDAAKEAGKKMIWLGVWEKNQRAIDFYTRWGFEKCGTHIFLLGSDPQTDWLMKKEL